MVTGLSEKTAKGANDMVIHMAKAKKNAGEKMMPKPITIVYDWLYNEPFGGFRMEHTSETYEDYHRVVRILHENKEKYRVVSVTR